MALKTKIARPGVQVQQILLENSPIISVPDQPTVIVGPNIQVVTDAADGLYDATRKLSAYPGLESGAVVRPASVRVRLTEVKLDIAMGLNGVVVDDKFTVAGTNFGARGPVATKTTSAVAATIDAFVPSMPVMDPGPHTLGVRQGVAAGSYVFSYNGVDSDELAAWPVEPVTIDGAEAGKITFTPAVAAPVLLPASDDITINNSLYVKVGDTVRFGAAEPFTTAKVASIADAGATVMLDREPGDSDKLPWTILRDRAAAVAVGADALEVTEDGFTIDAPITVDEAYSAQVKIPYMVMSARVRVDYEAYRQATANRTTTIANANEIEAKLMAVDERNPLALGVSLAKQNTLRSVLACAVDEDSELGYMRALSSLENENVYSIVCLTQSMSVATSLWNHVRQMSDKAKSKFRIGFINLAHPFEKTIVEETGAGTFVAATNEQNVQVVTLADPNAAFAGRVLVGDYLATKARAGAELPTNNPAAVGIFRVREIMNNSRLRLEPVKYAGSNGVYAPASPSAFADVAATYVDYEVIRVLDRDGQAEQIALTADSFAERRITYITNAECVVTINGDDKTVPGYYIAAALAGMASGFPPHQGFTNLGISGIKSVRFANRYFNDDQMGLIAANGGFLVVQDGEASLPVAFLQTTTDASTIQRRELSFTRVLDFYSTFLKNQLQQYIGPYNIYAATFTTLSNAVNAVHQEILGMEYDKIGAPVLAATLNKLVKSPVRPDGVEIVSTIVVPLPLNNISVTVQA